MTIPPWLPPWFTTWLRSVDVGTSSMTIGFVLLGAEGLLRDPSTPRDTSDVGRCIRLLDLAAKNGCDWRGRLHEVAVAVPEWAPLVARWAEIEAAYHADVVAQNAARERAFAEQERSRRPVPVGAWMRPPSRCWWLVSTLQGRGDPYQGHNPHPFQPTESA